MISSLNDGIERPRDGHYSDLNYVPWFACMRFAERLGYLDWIVAKRQVEADEWRAAERQKEIAAGATDFFLSDYVCSKASDRLDSVRRQRDIELDDRAPLNSMKTQQWVDGKLVTIFIPHSPRTPRQLYVAHLDSSRWKQRIRIRKMVSVGWACEYPGCQQQANDCHHLHYDTVGFEENCDLEALCRGHHEARHRENPYLAEGTYDWDPESALRKAEAAQ